MFCELQGKGKVSLYDNLQKLIMNIRLACCMAQNMEPTVGVCTCIKNCIVEMISVARLHCDVKIINMWLWKIL